MKDPIIEEIRKVRDKHAKKFNYDLNAICDDFNSKHDEYVNLLSNLKSDKFKYQKKELNNNLVADKSN